MRASGTVFAARSIFHQGLLLNISNKLLISYPELSDFQNYCENLQISNIAGGLSIYDNQDLFSNLVVGVANKSQLIDTCRQELVELQPENLPFLRDYRIKFMDPRKW